MESIWMYAIIGGFAPILFWLFFWLRNDFNEPEPRRLIFKTLIFGSIAAYFAVWIERSFAEIVVIGSKEQILLFSFIEEFAKLAAVFLAALGSVWNNEREDPMIYMITGALGFAAIENMYYTANYLQNMQYLESMVDGAQRFFGATLLHIVASGAIGFFISLVFFKRKYIRIVMALFGLSFATAIHFLFNFLISHQNEFYQDLAFWGAWGFVILIFIAFEFLRKKNKYRIINEDLIYISPVSRFKIKNLRIEKEVKKYEEYKKEKFRKKFY